MAAGVPPLHRRGPPSPRGSSPTLPPAPFRTAPPHPPVTPPRRWRGADQRGARLPPRPGPVPQESGPRGAEPLSPQLPPHPGKGGSTGRTGPGSSPPPPLLPAHSLVVVLCHVWRRQRAAELARLVGRARRGRAERAARSPPHRRVLSAFLARSGGGRCRRWTGAARRFPLAAADLRGGAAAPPLGGRAGGGGADGRAGRRWGRGKPRLRQS